MAGGIFAGMWEKRALGSGVIPEGWRQGSLFGSTAAGVTVTHEKALEYSAVFACIRNLAQDLAKIPLKVYKKRSGGRGQDEARDHPLYYRLHDRPNDEITSYTWREILQGHLGGWGNAYSQIRFDERGRVKDLWPLRPDYVEPVRDPQTKELFYLYRSPGEGEKLFPASYILHIPGFGYDGLQGYDPIRYAKNTIGLGMAAEEFGAKFYSNGANPGLVVKTPGTLSELAYNRLKKEMEAGAGLVNAHKPKIWEEGLEIESIGIHPESAQFLETRRFQTVEICRWYRMPPHKIQELERATFSNIEHQGIDYVVDSILPWVVNWEQGATAKLLTPREIAQGYFIKFSINGLMRGDIQTRGQYYALGRQWGWLSANDVLDFEDQNPLPNGKGDEYLVPLNMIPAGSSGDFGQRDFPTDGQNLETREARADDWEKKGRRVAQIRRRVMVAQIPILEDIAARCARREKNDVSAQARKMISQRPLGEFETWLDEFYTDHAEFVKRQFTPALSGYADLVAGSVKDEGFDLENEKQLANFVEAYAHSLGIRITGEHLTILRQKIESGLAGEMDLVALIEETLEGWVENQPGQIAHDEANRANNALAFSIYGMAGVIYLRSVAFGKSCPYCTALDGRVIGIQDYFLEAGQSFQPDGAEKPLGVNVSKRHPGYHRGCDCMVIAG